jgi:CubicO group peptidase (beta-lactamase class C family)
MKIFLSLFTLIFFFLSVAEIPVKAELSGQEVSGNSLDRAINYMRDQLQQQKIVGGIFGIVQQDQLVRSESIGFRDKNDGDIPKVNTVYSIASLTKTFTATAILQLQDKGLLDIDRPVSTYIPWFSFKNQKQNDQVTLRHLLSHSAGGVGSFQTDGKLLFANKKARNSLEDYIHSFNQVEMTEHPGQSGTYCNGCYDVLGLVIEYVTGMSYQDYMQQNVLEPLQMRNTIFGKDLNQLEDKHVATEYSWFFTRKMPMGRSYEVFGRSQDPDGGMYSTLEDLNKYLAFQLGYNTPLLNQLTIQQSRRGEVSTESGTAAYTTSGFELKEIDHIKTYFKNGDGIGSSTALLMIPDLDIGIVLLIGEFHPGIQQQIVEGAAHILLGNEAQPVHVQITTGKMVGIISFVLILLSTALLISLLIRRNRTRLLTTRKIVAALVIFGLLAFPFWFLLLKVRPTAIGFYGYPYDLAIGLVWMTSALSSWFIYYFIVVISKGFKKDKKIRNVGTEEKL